MHTHAYYLPLTQQRREAVENDDYQDLNPYLLLAPWQHETDFPGAIARIHQYPQSEHQHMTKAHGVERVRLLRQKVLPSVQCLEPQHRSHEGPRASDDWAVQHARCHECCPLWRLSVSRRSCSAAATQPRRTQLSFEVSPDVFLDHGAVEKKVLKMMELDLMDNFFRAFGSRRVTHQGAEMGGRPRFYLSTRVLINLRHGPLTL